MATKTAVKNSQEVPVKINIATVKGLNVLLVMDRDDRAELYSESGLVQYLETLEKPAICFNQDLVFSLAAESYAHNSLVGKNGILFGNRCELHYLQENRTDDIPSAVIVTDYKERSSHTKDFRALALLNADDTNDGAGNTNGPEFSLVAALEIAEDLPQVSFACLSKFFEQKLKGGKKQVINKVAKMIANGDIKLLSFTTEDRIKLTAAERQKLKGKGENSPIKPPKPGYSLVDTYGGGSWHRAGSTLFHDVKNDRFLIFGQDEGTFFGCELPCAVSTVADAFNALIPEEVKGKLYLRQGEWFMVGVPEKSVPQTKDCLLQFDTDGINQDTIFLPLETEDSKKHYIRTGDGRISKDGIFAHNPTLFHDDHAAVSWKEGWCTLYRNTALQSFSQEGVD